MMTFFLLAGFSSSTHSVNVLCSIDSNVKMTITVLFDESISLMQVINCR